MAVYVTSDAHGHVRALDRALAQASPGAQDSVYVLGDMIDRGPDPLGVVSLVRSLPHVQVILGNHEQLMLTALARSGEPKDGSFDLGGFDMDAFLDWVGWMQNGGAATADQLEHLSAEAYADFFSWASGLGRYAVAQAGGRTYALVHAGIDPKAARAWLVSGAGAGCDPSDPAVLSDLLAAQDEESLLWIRQEFWGCPTGLVDEAGRGPVVVAGHTPSTLLKTLTDDPKVEFTTPEGLGTIVRVGACEHTGGVADRIDIDCAAAAGCGSGRVGVLRLDDGAEWFAPVEEGE